jgi:replicative DNA helicase
MNQPKTPSELLDLLPPQDLESEKCVLGSILADSSVLDDVATLLDPKDFYADANQRIYSHLLAMRESGSAIDVKLLLAKLKDSGDFDRVGGVQYLAEVVNSVAVAAHAAHYATIVTTKANYRRLIHAATEALRRAYAAMDPPIEIANYLESALAEIADGDRRMDPVEVRDGLVKMLAMVEEIAKRKKSAGILTGLQRVDEIMGGFFPAELTILANRPGQGKTALAGQIVEHVSLHGHLVLFASLEMTCTELLLRQVCSISGVNSKLIRRGEINDQDLASLADAANRLSQGSLVILDHARQGVMEIGRAARRLKRRGLKLLVVDYLQRIHPGDSRSKRYEQIGEIARGLKSIAKELQIPVLCLCMAGRGAEASRRITMADMREGGDIEAEADVIMALTPYTALSAAEQQSLSIPFALQSVPKDSLRLLEFLKNRNSQSGLVWLGQWIPERTRFVWPNATGYSEFDNFSGDDL